MEIWTTSQRRQDHAISRLSRFRYCGINHLVLEGADFGQRWRGPHGGLVVAQHDGVVRVRAVPVAAVAVLSGTLLAILWSYRLVDGLSERAASAMLATDATDAGLST